MPPLRDIFGRRVTYLRISVTDRCNLRCVYCMPPGGVSLVPRSQILTYQELERLCGLLVAMGVKKIRVTGGEPLVRRGILTLLEKLRGLAGLRELCLTTNGVLLGDMARELKRVGVSRVNVSLDSLDSRTYAFITSRDCLPRVLEGISRALAVGFRPLKINMVVMRGVNHGEVLDFLELARDHPINVRFIEYMPFGSMAREEFFYPLDRVMETILSRYDLEPLPPSSGPARDYRVRGARGWVSFITPVTHPFCAGCNRIRITARGELRPCLLSKDVVDIKGPLRMGAGDGELKKIIMEAVAMKPRRHPLDRNVGFMGSMAHIGG